MFSVSIAKLQRCCRNRIGRVFTSGYLARRFSRLKNQKNARVNVFAGYLCVCLRARFRRLTLEWLCVFGFALILGCRYHQRTELKRRNQFFFRVRRLRRKTVVPTSMTTAHKVHYAAACIISRYPSRFGGNRGQTYNNVIDGLFDLGSPQSRTSREHSLQRGYVFFFFFCRFRIPPNGNRLRSDLTNRWRTGLPTTDKRTASFSKWSSSRSRFSGVP